VLVGASLALAAAVAPARAADLAPVGPAPPSSRQEEATPHPGDGRRTIGRLPANLGTSLVGVFRGDNLVPLLVGGAAAGASSFFDEDVRDTVTDQFAWSETFETAGGPLYSAVFVAGMFTAGRFAHGGRFRAMTYDMLDAAVVSAAYCSVLKVAVGRERPNGQDDKSFPSGHTANAFALAAVAERHYGWKVGAPAYALAALMGASRVNEDKHWLSDVVAGATLGYIVGRSVTRVNGRPLDDRARRRAALSVSPILARHARGVTLAVLF
jgi:membrane-associated phospholipid phosphatase